MSRVSLLISSVVVWGFSVSAQGITQIKIGVNGLTCSACTRSVEMSLRRLDFVDSVEMSLENTEGLLFTRKIYPIEFDKIAKAVTNAGFSVRFLQANLSLKDVELNDSGCFKLDGINFQWIDPDKSITSQTFTFVDASFLTGMDYSKWKKKIPKQSCAPGQPTFHVTHASL